MSSPELRAHLPVLPVPTLLPRLPVLPPLPPPPPAPSPPACPAAGGRRGRGLHSQVPARGVDSRPLGLRERLTRNRAELTARRVRDLQRDVADFPLAHPRNQRRLRRVLAVERLVPP